MPIGPAVRRAFGRYEPQVAEAWRAIFFDLDRFADLIQARVPHAARILEVGCGEGAMTQRLASRYPDAELLAIDITPRVGRLFQGDTRRVSFRQVDAQTVARERGSAFDLIVMSDVLHHVPPAGREPLLVSIEQLLASGGTFVLKDWMRAGTPIHWLCAASDVFLTGDRVSYVKAPELRRLLEGPFGRGSVVAQTAVPPWTNNQVFLVRKPPS